tara:strand:- start:631 stop:1455 length:825 start_codon:yes stop_codon:yes gene_type:complete
MKVVFTLVLYNNTLYEIKPLIDSLNNLNDKKVNEVEYILSVFDNSYKGISKKILQKYLNKDLTFLYKKSKKNIGFGKGHNQAFKAAHKSQVISDEDIVIITNPDISFESNQIEKLIDFLNKKINKEIVCVGPLLENNSKEIQYSAKRNPTVLSLLIGRFKFLERFFIFKQYISFNQNRSITNSSIIECDFLSGCFLLIRSKIFKMVEGFDTRYFLHFEDADITRTLQKHGKCIHYPFSKITHKWNRGSHKSYKQTLMLLSSMIKYFKKWGLSII